MCEVVGYHVGVIPAPRSSRGDNRVLIICSPRWDGFDGAPRVEHVGTVPPVVARLTDCSVVWLHVGVKVVVKMVMGVKFTPLQSCKSALLQIYWQLSEKHLSRTSYLLEGPFVERPLAGVHNASPSFIQCFRHVHVTLKTAVVQFIYLKILLLLSFTKAA